jgi:hypothetical protein
MYNSSPNSGLGFDDKTNKDYIDTLTIFVKWADSPFKCYSYFRHSICMLSIYDLPQLQTRHEYFANKFMLRHDPVSYQCMESWYDERVELASKIYLDMSFYCQFIQKRSALVDCGWRPNIY